MLNKKVKHIKFGDGTITDVSNGERISVNFEKMDENKTFQYPNGFADYLKFDDESLQNKAMEDLEEKNSKNQLEKEQRRLEFEKKFEEEKNERLAIEKEIRKEKRLKANEKKAQLEAEENNK